MNTRKVVHLLIALCCLYGFLPAQTEHSVLPSQTDPAANSPDNPHFAYHNAGVSQRGKLLVFFPGTGGPPVVYREILKVAANNGFHAIGLSYPNDSSINMMCISLPDTTCHGRAREEVLYGVDLHSNIAVDSNNCIQNRTLKLLQYLHGQYPAEQWNQFYANDNILWENILVAGHSQGGGHAAFISKEFEVARVLMFSWTDIVGPLGRNADYMTAPGPTPNDRYFAFIHEQDEAIPFSSMVSTWNNMDLFNPGSIVDVDTSTYPYFNSRTLITHETPRLNPSKYHGCTVSDLYTPESNGNWVFEPVWEYMLGVTPLTSIESEQEASTITVFPNPTAGILKVQGADNSAFRLIDVQGKVLQSGVLGESVDLGTCPKGIYFLEVSPEDGLPSRHKVLRN